MVFSAFGFYHFIFLRDFFTRATLIGLAKALAICALTFLPWQLYILYRFPAEAHFEYQYNNLHLFSAVEGHDGNVRYYFDLLKEQYKSLQLFIAIGMAACLLRPFQFKRAVSLAFTVILSYLFFSIAATKFPYLIIFIAPLNIIFLAVGIDSLIKWIDGQKGIAIAVQAILFCMLLFAFVDYHSIYNNHKDTGNWLGTIRADKTAKAKLYRRLSGILPQDAVIVDMAEHDNIDAMFYTHNPCYGAISDRDFRLLRQMKREVFFMADTLPVYAAGDVGCATVRELLTRHPSR